MIRSSDILARIRKAANTPAESESEPEPSAVSRVRVAPRQAPSLSDAMQQVARVRNARVEEFLAHQNMLREAAQLEHDLRKAGQSYGGIVEATSEFKRIRDLPRRELDLDSVPDLSPLYVREGSDHKLWPIQSAALIEAAGQNGLFASIRAGGGKTLIGLLMADALEADRLVYLMPTDLKKQLERELGSYCEHFLIPMERIRLVTYRQLSFEPGILDSIDPDAIVADECHKLKRKASARTKRFLKYLRRNPGVRLILMSGTVTQRSLRDYAHLTEHALGKYSPVPWPSYKELAAWCGALDAKPKTCYAPGVLTQFCGEGESVREGFRRRMAETPGVILTSDKEAGSTLIRRYRTIDIPDHIQKLQQEVSTSWRIEDDEIEEASRRWAILRQISCGFYYYWDWPDGIKDEDWLRARSAWNKEVRERLKLSLDGQDTPLLLANAAERYWQWQNGGGKGKRPKQSWESMAWHDWRLQKHKKPPPKETKWLDDFVIDAAVRWAKEQEDRAIIWYEHQAVGERLAKHFPHYGPGMDAGTATEPVITCSINTQGTGKNLQFRYSKNLFTSIPPTGSVWEQTAARTHRPKQPDDEVLIDCFDHSCRVSMDQILEHDALYMDETTGQLQRIRYATELPPEPL